MKGKNLYMNKLNFETKQDIKEYYLDLEVSEDARPDVIAERIVLSDCPAFNVPVKIVELNGDKHYRYIIGTNISYRYVNHSMSMKEFISLLNNMVAPFLECSDWFLDYHQFYLDVDHVYVDKNNLTVKYIYVFDKNVRCEDQDIKIFFTEVINDINITDNPSIQVEFYKYLLGKDFSLLGISELIRKYEGKGGSAQNTVQKKEQTFNNPAPAFTAAPKPAETSSAAAVQPERPKPSVMKPSDALDKAPAYASKKKTDTPEKKKETENVSVYSPDDLDNDIAEMLSNMNGPETSKEKNKSGGLFKKLFGKKNDGRSSEPEPGVADVRTEAVQEKSESVSFSSVSTEMVELNSDETQIIGADAPIESAGHLASLELISSSIDNAPDRIILDLRRGYMVIGRKTHDNVKNADFEFDGSVKRVSRKHLRIEQDGNEYRIVDLGSSNGTYVNDKKLIPNIAEKLANNSEITFAQNVMRYRFVVR